MTPGSATHLQVVQSPASAAAGTSFNVTIEALDAFGNVASSFSGPVTLSLATSPGNAVLNGVTSAQASAGVVTFSGLSLTRAGSNYTLKATSGSMTGTTSAFQVMAGTATQLVVTSQPPFTLFTGIPFEMVVKAEDAYGNVDSNYTTPITLTIANNPGNGTLGGTTSLTPSAGVAAYSNLTLSQAGVGYILEATSGNLSVATAPFISRVGLFV